MKPFETVCPHCGKKTLTYDPHGLAFCDKVCKTNYKYDKKFKQDQK